MSSLRSILRAVPIWVYVTVLAIPSAILILPRIAILFVGGWYYSIPSGSMAPTLPTGSTILALELSNETIPERGVVAIFSHPRNPEVDYVKRIVGLPGDTVQMIDGTLHLNGEAMSLGPLEKVEYLKQDNASSATPGCTPSSQHGKLDCIFDERFETLPGGRTYRIRDLGVTPVDNTQVFQVPDEHIMVLGDNRDNAVDSRFPALGMVPIANLKHKAWKFYTAPDPSGWPFRRFLETIE